MIMMVVTLVLLEANDVDQTQVLALTSMIQNQWHQFVMQKK